MGRGFGCRGADRRSGFVPTCNAAGAAGAVAGSPVAVVLFWLRSARSCLLWLGAWCEVARYVVAMTGWRGDVRLRVAKWLPAVRAESHGNCTTYGADEAS